jgi:hypothetical protein
MTSENSERLDEVELEEHEGELLPDREAMSVIDLGEGGGMSPPAFDAAEEPLEETPPITPDQPPTQ